MPKRSLFVLLIKLDFKYLEGIFAIGYFGVNSFWIAKWNNLQKYNKKWKLLNYGIIR
jgi:hypothetical protein